MYRKPQVFTPYPCGNTRPQFEDTVLQPAPRIKQQKVPNNCRFHSVDVNRNVNLNKLGKKESTPHNTKAPVAYAYAKYLASKHGSKRK